MKRNDFALKAKGWHRLIENAPALQTAGVGAGAAAAPFGFPSEVVLPRGGATLRFSEATVQAVQNRPDILRKARHVIKVILPDLLASTLHPENRGLALDLERVLGDDELLGVDLGGDEAALQGVARTFREALAAVGAARELLGFGKAEAAAGATVTYGRLETTSSPSSDEGLAARLDAVVGLARELADQLGPGFEPRPAGNVSRFAKLFEKLIVQAMGARGGHWEAQLAKARAKVEAAWDMVYELVRQVGLADGFMEDLRTMALPPLLAVQRERARLDFVRTCRRVVAAVAPGAGAEDPAFRPSQLEPPRLFDAWNP